MKKMMIGLVRFTSEIFIRTSDIPAAFIFQLVLNMKLRQRENESTREDVSLFGEYCVAIHLQRRI